MPTNFKRRNLFGKQLRAFVIIKYRGNFLEFMTEKTVTVVAETYINYFSCFGRRGV